MTIAQTSQWVAVIDTTIVTIREDMITKVIINGLRKGCGYVCYCGSHGETVDQAVSYYNAACVKVDDDDDVVEAHYSSDIIEGLWDGVFLGFSEKLGRFPDVHVFADRQGNYWEYLRTVLQEFSSDKMPEDISRKDLSLLG